MPSSQRVAIGFSVITCRPARAHLDRLLRMQPARRREDHDVGVGLRQHVVERVERGAPVCTAVASARAGSTSHTATSSARSPWRRIALDVVGGDAPAADEREADLAIGDRGAVPKQRVCHGGCEGGSRLARRGVICPRRVGVGSGGGARSCAGAALPAGAAHRELVGVPTVIVALDALIGVLRIVLFGGGVALAALAALSWSVRTRRINPFSPVARLTRDSIDPLFAPVERRVLRAGGRPATAPWWAVGAFVIVGIVVLSLLSFVLGQLAFAANALGSGAGIVRLLVTWTFGVLQVALLVRVISSWVQVSPYSKWVRWAFRLTEWFMRPLRQVIPTVGMIDLTPLVAYFVLFYLLQPFVLSLLPA